MENIFKRNDNIDYSISFVRFLACCSIVICHFLQYYGNFLAFWFNVGVQIFFFISGYLYSKKVLVTIKENISFVVKNVIKILVDYWIFILGFILLCLVTLKIPITKEIIINLIRIRNFPTEVGHLWFVKYILFCYFATPIYLKILDKIENKPSKMYVCFMLTLLILNDLIFKGLFNFIGAWMNCFLFGMLFFRIKKNNKISENVLITVVFILTLILNSFQIIIDYAGFNIQELLSKRFNEYIHYYAHATLGISLAIILRNLYFYFSKIIDKVIFILNLSDKYSYDVYICHQVFILGSFSLLSFLHINF